MSAHVLLNLSNELVSVPTCLQYQDQDSLVVKRRNDNHSPGPMIRELVPSSQQRSELASSADEIR